MSVHFSSKNDSWRTPRWVLDIVHRYWPITHDPCPDPQHPTWVSENYTAVGTDGLAATWPADGHSFVNPPYSQLRKGEWSDKIVMNKGQATALVPSRTDTQWWQILAKFATIIFMFQGRLKFGEAKNSAPFPSCLMTFNWEPLDRCGFGKEIKAIPVRRV